MRFKSKVRWAGFFEGVSGESGKAFVLAQLEWFAGRGGFFVDASQRSILAAIPVGRTLEAEFEVETARKVRLIGFVAVPG